MAAIPLYGGALSYSLPSARLDKPSVAFDLIDMSDFRQIPDHQEVRSDVSSGCVVIVELLGTAEKVPDAECGAYYFSDLAECNGCDASKGEAVLTSSGPLADADCPNFPSSGAGVPTTTPPTKFSAEGYQRISKFTNESDSPNEVYVGMAIVRLPPPVASDLVVSVSVPTKIHPNSSEAKVVTPETIMTVEEAQRILRCAVASLKVERWSLFV